MELMSCFYGATLAALVVLAVPLPYEEVRAGDAPIRVIRLLVPDATCKCEATPVAATDKKIVASQYSGCSPSTVPYIYITSDADDGPCNMDGENCVTQANSKCSASVTATLVFPQNSCLTQVGVTGPGIGDGTNPCQTASDSPSQPPVSCTWDLSADCKVGASPTTGKADGSMKVFAVGCASGQPPSGGADAEYKPQLNCGVCSRTDQG